MLENLDLCLLVAQTCEQLERLIVGVEALFLNALDVARCSLELALKLAFLGKQGLIHHARVVLVSDSLFKSDNSLIGKGQLLHESFIVTLGRLSYLALLPCNLLQSHEMLRVHVLLRETGVIGRGNADPSGHLLSWRGFSRGTCLHQVVCVGKLQT